MDGSVAATHSPVTTNITGLIKVEHTVGHADEYLRQTYYPYRATGGYYTRVRNNNVWGDWVLQPTRAEIDAVTNRAVGYTIQAGASVEVDYSSYTSAVVFISRAVAGSTPTVAICDAWSGVAYVSNNTNYSVSVSNKKVTITNNTTSACSYGVYMF